MADFRTQKGIYILYGNLGPHYVGLTDKQTLGDRLKQHLSNEHIGRWDRFSWFTFAKVLKGKTEEGLQSLGDPPTTKALDPSKAIKDIEALLIKAMAMNNVKQMKFVQADEWKQVKATEADDYLNKIKKP